MVTIIFIILIVSMCKAGKSIAKPKRHKTRGNNAAGSYKPVTTAQLEKAKRAEIKVKQALLDIDFYAGIIETQTELISVYNQRIDTIRENLDKQRIAYTCADPVQSVNLFADLIGFDADKATKQIETITRQKQSAENKLVLAKKRMESAKLIVELYS